MISDAVPFCFCLFAGFITLKAYNYVNDGRSVEELLGPIRSPLCFYAQHEWPSWRSSVKRFSALHRAKWPVVLVKAWETRGSWWPRNLFGWFHHVAQVVVLTQHDCKAVLKPHSEHVIRSVYRWGRRFRKDWIFISLRDYISSPRLSGDAGWYLAWLLIGRSVEDGHRDDFRLAVCCLFCNTMGLMVI